MSKFALYLQKPTQIGFSFGLDQQSKVLWKYFTWINDWKI